MIADTEIMGPAQWNATLQGAAMAAIIAERREQLRRGHDADADAMLPLDALPRAAGEYLRIAKECIQGIHGEQDLIRAQKKLAQSAALMMAAYDRLELVTAAKA